MRFTDVVWGGFLSLIVGFAVVYGLPLVETVPKLLWFSILVLLVFMLGCLCGSYYAMKRYWR